MKNKLSNITREKQRPSRRSFNLMLGATFVGTILASSCKNNSKARNQFAGSGLIETTDELGNPLTELNIVTNYNNYYEFAYDKKSVSTKARGLPTTHWQISIGGLVNNPINISVEDILKRVTLEERIYRMRCIEGWSMVIPWLGFPLAYILNEVEPLPDAKFVSFESLHNPKQMPNQNNIEYPWPYQEGLRLDEAMHSLTILAIGMYGKELLPQNGAPIRLVVPWKYGFKSIKSVVKIDLVNEQPLTFWHSVAPEEYGFYANVNPNVPHPRWSQSSEIIMGGIEKKPTLMFNGYEDVSHIYTGMDLRIKY